MSKIIPSFDFLISFFAVLVTAYLLLNIFFLFHDSMEAQAVCLAFAFIIIFLTAAKKTESIPLRTLYLTLMIIGIASAGYFLIYYSHLEASAGFPENRDLIAGVVLVVILLIATWAAWGALFSTMAIIVTIYLFFGHLLPDPLYHSHITFADGMTSICVGLQGVFGWLLGVVPNFLLLLIIFGCLLDLAGANTFFMEIGKAASRYLQGGIAHTAVIGSGLVGATTGAAAANVVITGSMTIPLMKKMGYKPATAGGIEAAASTGSQYMPPVMGVAAFLMANNLGVPYLDIVKAGLIPALLYYGGIIVSVQLLAKKHKIISPPERIDYRKALTFGPIPIFSIALLITLLTMRYSIAYTVYYCLLTLVTLIFIHPATRPSLSVFLEAVVRGAVIALKMAAILATVGIMSQVIITTGLGTKLAHLVITISNNQLPLIIFFTALLCFFLGQGVPTAAAYLLVATLLAPALIQSGLDKLEVHFFVFYFAVLAAITPPVALASVAASQIAGSGVYKTGWEAVKIASAGFILPFLFFTAPELLMQGGDFWQIGIFFASAMLLISCVAGITYGFFFRENTAFDYIMLIMIIITTIYYFFSRNRISMLLAVAIFVYLLASYFLTQKAPKIQRRGIT